MKKGRRRRVLRPFFSNGARKRKHKEDSENERRHHAARETAGGRGQAFSCGKSDDDRRLPQEARAFQRYASSEVYDASHTRCEGRRGRSLPGPPEDRGLRTPTSAVRDPITAGRHRASQSAPRSNLVPSVLNSWSIICSKVFPSSSLARLTSLPSSSTYSASTGNSATLATTSSSTISPFSS